MPSRWVREAAGNDDVEAIDSALDAASDRDAALNKGDISGRTALHWAAGRGRADAVRHLLSLGARVRLSSTHQTPLHDLACSGAACAPSLVDDLVAAAPWQLTRKDITGCMPVERAKNAGYTAVVRALEAAAMTVTGAEHAMASTDRTYSIMPSCLTVVSISLNSPESSVHRPLLQGA
tara:strand:- start:176 stop:709 length:534 start_codon:yes stop_codon:yes gene_type:complete